MHDGRTDGVHRDIPLSLIRTIPSAPESHRVCWPCRSKRSRA